MPDSEHTKTMTLPVKLVDGHWEWLLEGGVPLKAGAIAELTVALHAIKDPAFLERATAERTVKALPAETRLLVALSDRARSVANPVRYDDLKMDRKYLPGPTYVFVPIHVGPPTESQIKQHGLFEKEKLGGVFLHQKGLDRTELLTSTIRMPEGFSSAEAQSLNHAFTMLSERYETHRLSHTGNIYVRVFYEESNGRWYPLGELRQGLRLGAERKVIHDAWQALEKSLGFAPIRPADLTSAKAPQKSEPPKVEPGLV